ncbi:MAG: cell division protein FtsA [Chloroflexi bacterium]|nr:cell division protein FtsA [Chloroflexota bacterium]
MIAPTAVVDVGTSKICALVGERTERGNLRVLGAGVVPSRGLRKGVVVDVNQAAESIARAVEQAERVSGFNMHSAVVSISGTHIESANSRGIAAIHGDRAVTQEDIDRALESAEAIAVPQNREIVHAIPRGYTLDGQEGVKEPLGMIGFRLEVDAHIATGAVPPIQNLLKATQSAGVTASEIVFAPIASGEAALTPAEKEMGVILADIGGGTTDIAVFIDGSVWKSIVLPIGGMNITNDLAVGLRTPFAAAEELKIQHGRIDLSGISEDQNFDVASFGEEGHRPISLRLTAEIIDARVEEILHLILTEIKRSGYDNLLPAGVVLCGGAASLPGLKAKAREVLKMPVRIGFPLEVEGFSDRVSTPAFATAIGLLHWSARESSARSENARSKQTRSNALGGLFGWAKRALLPG